MFILSEIFCKIAINSNLVHKFVDHKVVYQRKNLDKNLA